MRTVGEVDLSNTLEDQGDDDLHLPEDATALIATEGVAASYIDGAPVEDIHKVAVHRALRSSSRLVNARAMRIYRLSLSKALRIHKSAAQGAVTKELQQLLDRGV